MSTRTGSGGGSGFAGGRFTVRWRATVPVVDLAAGFPEGVLAVVGFFGAGFLAGGLFAADFLVADFFGTAFLAAAFDDAALLSWLAAKGEANEMINKAVMRIPEGSPHVAGG
jgi:hypothetical protein